MLKSEANAILDRIKYNQGYVSLAKTNKALERTGDISSIPCESLRPFSHESRNDRTIPIESKRVEVGFSYSRYLDCKKTEGTQE